MERDTFIEVQLTEEGDRKMLVNLRHIVSLAPPDETSAMWGLQLVAGGVALHAPEGQRLCDMLLSSCQGST